MATISTLAVNLIARTSVFEKRMRRSRRTVKNFKTETRSAALGMASFAKGLLLGGGAIFAIKSFTAAASQAQETMNLFNTVFAENAAVTAKWADDFAKNVGRSRTEVREWAASLQDTFVPLGLARDRAAELSKSLVELAVDVASFKNIASDREVIDSFTSAIVGNHRAVRAYGVVLTNATIEQESFASGVNKVFSKLTELEKVQLRYNIILNSTKDAQGDALKTADNYANRVKNLEGSVQDLKEAIGFGLIPAMTSLVTKMDEFSDSANSFDRVGRMIAGITDLLLGVKGILQLIVGIVQTNLTAALKAVGFNVKSLIITFSALNNAMADTKIGEALGAKTVNVSKVLNAIDEITSTFEDAAKKNTLEGARTVTDAVLGSSVKAYEKLIAEANKKATAALNANRKISVVLPDGQTEGMAELSKQIKKSIQDAEKQVAKFDISDIEAKIKRLETSISVEVGVEFDDSSSQNQINDFKTKLSQLEEPVQAKVAIDIEGIKELKAKLLDVQINGLTPLEAKIKDLKEQGQIEFGIDFDALAESESKLQAILDLPLDQQDFINGIKEMESLLAQLTQKEYLGKLADEAKTLKESLKGPAERILDIRERLAEMLESGFINSDEFDEALAKAKEGLAGKEQGFGRFSEIRSEFIDVAALNGANQRTEVQESNELLREQNRILKEIANENRRESIT